LYNVTDKDVGRRLKCKKCSASLKVTGAGLEADARTDSTPSGEARPLPVPDPDADGRTDEPRPRRRVNRDRERRPLAVRVGDAVDAVGGIPTALFGAGVFLVIFFAFMDEIGRAGIARADAGIEKVKADQAARLREALPAGKSDPGELTEDERKTYQEKESKIRKAFAVRLADAKEEAEFTRLNTARSVWVERYGLMFGFMFVAFGCLGYLRSEQALTLKIVAGVILAFMMMMVFVSVGGRGCRSGPGEVAPPGAPGKGKGSGPGEG
jgi:hypothetical protein